MVLDTSNNQGKRHQPYLRLPREDRSPTATPQYLLRDTTLDVVEEFSSRESKRGVHRTCARTPRRVSAQHQHQHSGTPATPDLMLAHHNTLPG